MHAEGAGPSEPTGADDHPGHRGYARDEPVAAQLDRNYGELLQETRVVQTGVQILFAFLLTIPFQSAFGALDDAQRAVYVSTLLSAAVSVVLLIAPVATHRMLFRRGLKDTLVRVTARLAAGGLIFLAVSILGAVGLIVDVVVGDVAAVVITVVLAALVGTLWLLVPRRLRRDIDRTPGRAAPDGRVENDHHGNLHGPRVAGTPDATASPKGADPSSAVG